MNEKIVTDVFEEEDTQKGKFLTFSLGSELYGVEILYVTEIVGVQPITVVPELPDYIKGIINLRGKIIPVMDARLKFKKTALQYNDRTCIIVIDMDEISIGLIVDSVSEVLNIAEQDLVLPPKLTKDGKKYIKSIAKTGDDITLILDCAKLLDEDEIADLSNI
jgi:purine-binding chemotaxis protein CheW